MNLTLKNVPADVHRRLKKRARANHRSLNGEAILVLANGTLHESADVGAIISELERLNSLQKGAVTFKESRAGIEEGRE
jgi:plasmid stability protein